MSETMLYYELQNGSLSIQRQVPVPITYDNMLFIEGFRADLIADGKVVLESLRPRNLCRWVKFSADDYRGQEIKHEGHGGHEDHEGLFFFLSFGAPG